MVKVPLGRGCHAVVTDEEVKRMLLQPQNEEVYLVGVRRGKGEMRWQQSQERQKQEILKEEAK